MRIKEASDRRRCSEFDVMIKAQLQHVTVTSCSFFAPTDNYYSTATA